MANERERRLKVTAVGDTRSAGQALDDLGTKADGVGSKLGALKTTAGLAFAGMGAGAVAFGKAGIDAASDMRESMGKMEQIFNTRAEMSAVSSSKMMDDAGDLTKAQEAYAKALENAEGKVGKDRDKAVAKANEWRDKVSKAQAAVTENERLNAEAHAKFMREGAALSDENGKAIAEWAKGAATGFGQSRQQAIDAASSFAMFGKAAGQEGPKLVEFSTKLTGLASDLASFNNTSPEDAINALGAALRGESEPMRRYGVMLNDASLKAQALKMGLYDGKGALDDQAKTMAAYELILNSTKDAQGDFAKTSEGMANQQRIQKAQMDDLKVAMGDALLPVMAEATKAVTALAVVLGPLIVDFAQKLGPAIQGAVGWFKDLAAVFKEGGLGGLFDKLGTDVSGAWDKTIKPALSGLIEKVGGWLRDEGPKILKRVGESYVDFLRWEYEVALPKIVEVLGNLVGAVAGWFKEHKAEIVDALKTFGEAFLDWAGEIAGIVLPALAKVATAIGGWIKENGPPILAQLGEWTLQFLAWVGTDLAPKLLDALGEVIGFVGAWIKDSGPELLGQLAEWTGQFVAWLGGLGLKLGEWALRNTPKLLGWIVDVAPEIVAKLAEWTGKFAWWLAGLSVELGKEALKLTGKLFGWLVDLAAEIPGHLLKWTAEFGKWLLLLPIELAKKAAEFGGSALGWIAGMAKDIPGQLGEWTKAFGDWAAGLPSSIVGGFKDLTATFGNMIVDAFKEAWNWAARQINRKTPFGDPIPTFDMSDAGAVHAQGPWTGADGQTMPSLPGKTGGTDATAVVGVKIAMDAFARTVQDAFDTVKPDITVDPQVDPQDLVRLAGTIGRGINTAMKNPGNAIALLLDDPDFQAKVQSSVGGAVAKTNANPPAKVVLPVDEDDHNTTVVSTAAKAIAALNSTDPKDRPKVTLPVDDDWHGNAVKNAFTNAVTGLNGWADRAKALIEADGNHLENDTKGKAGAAVAAANAHLVSTGAKLTVEVDTEGIVAKFKAAAEAAVSAAQGIMGALGNLGGNTDPGPKPTTVAALGARQGGWVMTIRGWEIWDGNGANVQGIFGPDVGMDTLTVSPSRGSFDSSRYGGVGTAASGSVPVVVVGATGGHANGYLDLSTGGTSGTGGSGVGTGNVVVHVENLVGSLTVPGVNLTQAQARDIARQIFEPFKELVVSKGHVTVNGLWRVDA